MILLTAKVLGASEPTLDVAAVIAKPFDPLRLPAQIARALGWAARTR